VGWGLDWGIEDGVSGFGEFEKGHNMTQRMAFPSPQPPTPNLQSPTPDPQSPTPNPQCLTPIAIIRKVSSNINQCELSFHERRPIDVTKAIEQHKDYQRLLSELGLRTVELAAEPDLPDSVFVEDPAVVVDEVAVISRMGAISRRPEADSLAQELFKYRRLEFLTAPATLDGGDVMRVGRVIYVGESARTNREGIEQFSRILKPFGYDVRAVAVTGCLHLKSASSYVGANRLLVNRSLIDSEMLSDYELIDVPMEEPGAANALLVNGVVVLPESFPKTRALLERRGIIVQQVDMSELQKAEAGVTCCSLIFEVPT
jgi:dimethylargininase